MFKEIKIIGSFLKENGKIINKILQIVDKKLTKQSINDVVDSVVSDNRIAQEQNRQLKQLIEHPGFNHLHNLQSIHESLLRLLSEKLYLNDVLAFLHQQIEKNSGDFNKRLNENKGSKIAIRESIRDIIEIVKPLRERKSFFFQSGTTLANSALPVIKDINTIRRNNITGVTNPIKLCTNNTMVYLNSIYEEHIEPLLLKGKPLNPFGATYGDASNPRNCNIEEVNRFLEENKVEVLFSTATFWDIKYGPNVTSIFNYQLKKTCLDYFQKNQNCIKIYIIASEHIHTDNIKDECKFIFYPEAEMYRDLKSNPQALEEVHQNFSSFLQSKNFVLITGSENRKTCEEVTEMILNKYEFLTNKYMYPKIKEYPDACVSIIRNKDYEY